MTENAWNSWAERVKAYATQQGTPGNPNPAIFKPSGYQAAPGVGIGLNAFIISDQFYQDDTVGGDPTIGTMPGKPLDIDKYRSALPNTMSQTTVFQVFAGKTPQEVGVELAKMDSTELASVQFMLYQMGMYQAAGLDGPPVFSGIMDDATITAFSAFQQFALMQGDVGMSEVVARGLRLGANERLAAGDGEEGPHVKYDENGNLITDLLPEQISTPSVESIEEDLDEVAIDLLGRTLDPAVRRQMAERMKQKHVDNAVGTNAQLRQAEFDANNTQGLMDPGGASPEFDSFMQSIAMNESGGDYNAQNATGSGAFGKYQIMPQYWESMAIEAGLSGSASQSPVNQERVARFHLAKYLKYYDGDYRKAAMAWYAGVQGANNVISGKSSGAAGGGYPSIQRYGDKIVTDMWRYANHDPTKPAIPGATGTGPIYTNTGAVMPDDWSPGGQLTGGDMQLVDGEWTMTNKSWGPAMEQVDAFDQDLEYQNAIKAQNPDEWGAYQFVERAQEFYGLVAQAALRPRQYGS